MIKTQELLTVAKIAAAWDVPKARLAKRLKEEGVEPDQVKAGCAYFDVARLEAMRERLDV